MDNASPPPRRKVGVYDRPESADRGAGLKKLIVVAAIVVAVAIAVIFVI